MIDYSHADESFSVKSHQSKRSLFIATVFLLIGMLLGFLLFDRMRLSLVQQALAETEIRHNQTLKILLERLELATQETHECLDDDSETLELAELRGKLTALLHVASENEQLQVDLQARHRQLEEAKNTTQQKEDEYLQLMQTFERQQVELEQVSKEHTQLSERASRLSEQRNGLTRQLKALDTKADELHSKVSNYENQVDQFKNRILQREAFQCKEEYGLGPYYVQVTATTRGKPDSKAWSFVIELASRRDMPHSVYTFLSLVSYEMLDGTTFVSKDRKIMSLAMTIDAEVSFNQKRQAVGMDESIIMFPEVSSRFPCQELSVGFQGLGPTLDFFLSAPGNDQSCFGKVVRGGESAKLIRDLVFKGTAIDIVHVQHLEL